MVTPYRIQAIVYFLGIKITSIVPGQQIWHSSKVRTLRSATIAKSKVDDGGINLWPPGVRINHFKGVIFIHRGSTVACMNMLQGFTNYRPRSLFEELRVNFECTVFAPAIDPCRIWETSTLFKSRTSFCNCLDERDAAMLKQKTVMERTR